MKKCFTLFCVLILTCSTQVYAGKSSQNPVQKFFDKLFNKPHVSKKHDQSPLAKAFRGQDKHVRKELQAVLQEQGLYTSKIDGWWGPGTRKAIEAFAVESGNLHLLTSKDGAAELMTLMLNLAEDRQTASSDLDAKSVLGGMDFTIPDKFVGVWAKGFEECNNNYPSDMDHKIRITKSLYEFYEGSGQVQKVHVLSENEIKVDFLISAEGNQSRSTDHFIVAPDRSYLLQKNGSKVRVRVFCETNRKTPTSQNMYAGGKEKWNSVAQLLMEENWNSAYDLSKSYYQSSGINKNLKGSLLWAMLFSSAGQASKSGISWDDLENRIKGFENKYIVFPGHSFGKKGGRYLNNIHLNKENNSAFISATNTDGTYIFINESIKINNPINFKETEGMIGYLSGYIEKIETNPKKSTFWFLSLSVVEGNLDLRNP